MKFKVLNIKLNNSHIIWLIIGVAALLRFYNFKLIPLTHDEFSALFRLQFSSFSELIQKGVKPDGHPAGVQVFLYYWTHLFGIRSWIIKMPFAIAGLVSVFLIYQIGKIWYNPTIGIIAAAFLATMQFTIMYSQIARPYISGLFLSLAMVYYWSRLIFHPEKKPWMHLALYVFFSAACAYNHYFSLLFAIVVGFAGLFFIERNHLKAYIGAGIAIFLLFLPYFSIFLYQLNLGGVGQWLHKPSPYFFTDFLSYLFNFSVFEYSIVVGLVSFGFWKLKKSNFTWRKWMLFAGFFLIPLLTGYFYSVYVNPVLQFSVLIFSMPFLFFILFSHIRKLSPQSNLILAVVIMSVNIYALIFIRHHYSVFYQSIHEHIVTDCEVAKKNYAATAFLVNTDPEINDFYFRKLVETENEPVDFTSLGSIHALKKYIIHPPIHSDYFYLGTLSGIDPHVIPVIRDYFPKIVWQHNYFTGTTYLFSKDGKNTDEPISTLTFDTNPGQGWSNIKDAQIIDSNFSSPSRAYQVEKKEEYLFSFTEPLDSILKDKNNFIDISVRVYSIEDLGDVFLVGILHSKDQTLSWGASKFQDFILESDTSNWVDIHYSLKISDIDLHSDSIQFQTYVWNKGHKSFLLDDYNITLRRGNPIIYGLYEPIPNSYTTNN